VIYPQTINLGDDYHYKQCITVIKYLKCSFLSNTGEKNEKEEE
jgi:hypothetical protein